MKLWHLSPGTSDSASCALGTLVLRPAPSSLSAGKSNDLESEASFPPLHQRQGLELDPPRLSHGRAQSHSQLIHNQFTFGGICVLDNWRLSNPGKSVHRAIVSPELFNCLFWNQNGYGSHVLVTCIFGPGTPRTSVECCCSLGSVVAG